MVKPKTLMITGKTEQEWIDEMKVLELADEQGIKKPKIRMCYLCKRAEGENSLALNAEKEDEVILSKIELRPYEISLGGNITFSYLLCMECSLLLNAMESTEEDESEE